MSLVYDHKYCEKKTFSLTHVNLLYLAETYHQQLLYRAYESDTTLTNEQYLMEVTTRPTVTVSQ